MIWLGRIWDAWSRWIVLSVAFVVTLVGFMWRIRKGAKAEVKEEIREANMKAYLRGEEAEKDAHEDIDRLSYSELVERMREAGTYVD